MEPAASARSELHVRDRPKVHVRLCLHFLRLSGGQPGLKPVPDPHRLDLFLIFSGAHYDSSIPWDPEIRHAGSEPGSGNGMHKIETHPKDKSVSSSANQGRPLSASSTHELTGMSAIETLQARRSGEKQEVLLGPVSSEPPFEPARPKETKLRQDGSPDVQKLEEQQTESDCSDSENEILCDVLPRAKFTTQKSRDDTAEVEMEEDSPGSVSGVDTLSVGSLPDLDEERRPGLRLA